MIETVESRSCHYYRMLQRMEDLKVALIPNFSRQFCEDASSGGRHGCVSTDASLLCISSTYFSRGHAYTKSQNLCSATCQTDIWQPFTWHSSNKLLLFRKLPCSQMTRSCKDLAAILLHLFCSDCLASIFGLDLVQQSEASVTSGKGISCLKRKLRKRKKKKNVTSFK